MAAAAAVAVAGTPLVASAAHLALAAAVPHATHATRKRKSSPEIKNASTNKKKPSPPTISKSTKTAAKKQACDTTEPANDPSQTSGMCPTATTLIQTAMAESNACDIPPTAPFVSTHSASSSFDGRPQTAAQKKQTSRDRNREHARCTRLRKKAYVSKLKDLVDGLHTERSEDARKRRVAVQHLAEIQELRRKVVHTFLGYHSGFEKDADKWGRILEGKEFWLKQPVTPYRSFRRCEIQKGSRILKGIDAMVRDSASMSVMIETVGSRNLRWQQRKRDDFLTSDANQKHPHTATRRIHGASHRVSQVDSSGTSSRGANMPHSIMRRNSRLQHAISSLSSSSGSSTGNGSGSDEERRLAQRNRKIIQGKGNADEQRGHRTSEDKKQGSSTAAKKVSSSSSNDGTRPILHNGSNDFHDYHAPSLLDPLPEPGGSSPGSDSRRGGGEGGGGFDLDNCVVVGGNKHMCTDSSSGEDDKVAAAHAHNKRKGDDGHAATETAQAGSSAGVVAAALRPSLPPNIARSGGILHNVQAFQPQPTSVAAASSITALLPNGQANLSRAPATTLPPFVGLGKRNHAPTMNHPVSSSTAGKHVHPMDMSSSNTSESLSGLAPNPLVAHHPSGNNNINNSKEENNSSSNPSSSGNIITIDDTSSSQSSQNPRGIQAHYHINEDDMILTDDVLMCPFIFRSQEAVWCGALAECVQPGMLRANFSPTNKLRNVEMIFDAMGFCQQLERASGNEGMAQIIPNSLEMALAPNTQEARVITQAKAPFRIVSVNEEFSNVTGYTQLDAEGKDLSTLLYGERTDLDAGVRSGMPTHDFENVAKGVCAASTNVHYDIDGREFLNFMCSYPLSNLSNEVTHILHVCQELPARA